MNETYRLHVAERSARGLPPLPLDAEQTKELLGRLRDGDAAPDLLELLADRIAPGVTPSARLKAEFLAEILSGRRGHPAIPPVRAAELLGRMAGGYNAPPLVEALEAANPQIAMAAARALSRLPLVGEQAEAVARLARGGRCPPARMALENWERRAWLDDRPEFPVALRLRIHKVDGEINTDDLSPARHAPTRPDIPLHALSMGETRFPGGVAEIARLRALAAATGAHTAFASDVLGTGSSRKSAVNSLLWHIGTDIPGVPNKRRGGVALAERIAPIFRDTLEDAGALPLVVDSCARLENGMEAIWECPPPAHPGAERPFVLRDAGGRTLASGVVPAALPDNWRSGGRILRIVGDGLARFAAQALRGPSASAAASAASTPAAAAASDPRRNAEGGYTLAQKWVGRACGLAGVRPGAACEPKMETVGSQDTTGPMTRDELEELACLAFSAGLVLQSFCHTAAYPTDRDRKTHQTLPDFMIDRGGVALRPGDGIIHSCLNRLLLPDGVGAGGDSHTRFPLGISFPGGSGLVAFAAAFGFMPLTMPESVLVRFSGERPPGISWRDAVNAIPLRAIEAGLSDAPGHGTRNIFNGRILEMEGLGDASVEEAFELTCASAERSAAAATVDLSEAAVASFLRSSAAWIRQLVNEGYRDASTLQRRLEAMEAWLAKPSLLRRDPDAGYAATLDVPLDAIAEPILACPNNPDKVAWLRDAGGTPIDEVFIGSCMTHAGHFRIAAKLLAGSAPKVKRLWIVPPTRMDEAALSAEGILPALSALGARVEIPGCSLCMGNQARVEDGAAVLATSTRNFDNRMGRGASVYLGSAEVAAITAKLGRIPTPDEYFAAWRGSGLPAKRISPLSAPDAMRP